MALIPEPARNGAGAASRWSVFILYTLLLLWLLHAIAFFAHEYAHSFTAWVLGWKSQPLALHYGHLTMGNLLLQIDIDENVDYVPIFASGHGGQAALIAAAGVVLGNGLITYLVSCWGYWSARKKDARLWGLFFYWLNVASVGNFIAYVPVRTFTSHGDMHTAAIGFGCSPWWIIVVPGLPFAAAVVYFFRGFVPEALCWLFPRSAGRRIAMAVLTVAMFFGFYGIVGWSGYGAVSHMMSVFSLGVFLPVVLAAEMVLINRGVRANRLREAT